MAVDLPYTTSDLRKQAMKLRHPSLTGQVSQENLYVLDEAAQMLSAIAHAIDQLAFKVLEH